MVLQEHGQNLGEGITGITCGFPVADGELINFIGGNIKMGLDMSIIFFQRQKAFNFTSTKKFRYPLLDGIVHLSTPGQTLKFDGETPFCNVSTRAISSRSFAWICSP